MKRILFFLISLFVLKVGSAQYWQQAVDYTMEVTLDTETALYNGTQKLVYTNNSPETLNKVFYHLYFNAFKPGSEMAVRLKNAADKNRRFKISVDSLTQDQQGYLKVSGLTQDGVKLSPIDSETILEVPLNKPILPGESTTFELSFEGHVPDVIRRAGKNSSEGVAFSMAQWYPKMAEYDHEGWNADPYTGREFHGVWGDFDVKITLNKKFVVAASGYLQNADDIGMGYSDRKKPKAKKGNVTWHFIAPQVHDFTWAAVGILFTFIVHLFLRKSFFLFSLNIFKPNVLMYREDQSGNYYVSVKNFCSFLNFYRLKIKLDQIPESEHAIVDFSLCDFVDHTVMEGLHDYQRSFARKNGVFETIGLDIHASETQHPFAVRKSLPINVLMGLQNALSNRQKNIEQLAQQLAWNYNPKIENDPKGINRFLFFESKVVNYSVNSLYDDTFTLFDLSFSEGAFITKEDLKGTFLLFKSPIPLPNFVLDKEDFKTALYHWAGFDDINFTKCKC
jgi:hypothetical protein